MIGDSLSTVALQLVPGQLVPSDDVRDEVSHPHSALPDVGSVQYVTVGRGRPS